VEAGKHRRSEDPTDAACLTGEEIGETRPLFANQPPLSATAETLLFRARLADVFQNRWRLV
jgi:hypothetical protein